MQNDNLNPGASGVRTRLATPDDTERLEGIVEAYADGAVDFTEPAHGPALRKRARRHWQTAVDQAARAPGDHAVLLAEDGERVLAVAAIHREDSRCRLELFASPDEIGGLMVVAAAMRHASTEWSSARAIVEVNNEMYLRDERTMTFWSAVGFDGSTTRQSRSTGATLVLLTRIL